MLRSVAVIAIPEMAPFEFGVLAEVFGIDRSDQGGPRFDFHVVTPEPGLVAMKNGLALLVSEGLEAAATADLVAVPAFTDGDVPVDPRILATLREAERRGAWVLSVCSGAFALAAAGLLDGRRSTTHWMHADDLARSCPATTVDPDVLFVEDRRVITGAGTAAGIDACLHLVRTELGAAAANVIARRMVVPPQRDGGQAQYIQSAPEHERVSSLATVTSWMVENLAEDQPISALARRAHMSERTFARRFRAELGATPRRLAQPPTTHPRAAAPGTLGPRARADRGRKRLRKRLRHEASLRPDPEDDSERLSPRLLVRRRRRAHDRLTRQALSDRGGSWR